jgi:hypothetical protein
MTNRFDYLLPCLQADPKVTSEELRRATVADAATARAGHYLNDLNELLSKDLRVVDVLQTLGQTGLRILELSLHTKGRLKAAEGRSDAFLEATSANVKAAFREAIAVMDECDVDLGAWTAALEAAKPAVEDLTRISKAMDRPGIKTAVMPAGPAKEKPAPGPALFQDDGESALAHEPEPPTEPTPMPYAAPLTTLGCVIDVDAEIVPTASDESTDEFDMWSDEERDEAFQMALDRLEEEGVQEGLKRKNWPAADKAWQAAWETFPKDTFRRLTFAVYYRKGITWDIPQDGEMEAYEQAQAKSELPWDEEFPLPQAAGGEV